MLHFKVGFIGAGIPKHLGLTRAFEPFTKLYIRVSYAFGRLQIGITNMMGSLYLFYMYLFKIIKVNSFKYI